LVPAIEVEDEESVTSVPGGVIAASTVACGFALGGGGSGGGGGGGGGRIV
jgi:hypothetical protein